jgi:putative transposase
VTRAREALGRSRGGLTTKLHAACDALGNPLRLLLAPGQRGDVRQAEALLQGLAPAAVVADRAYDADHLVSQIYLAGAEVVIPPNPSRSIRRRYDKELYRERNLIERFFGRLKHYRRIATRYDKTARNYLSFVQVASTLMLLR